MPSSGSPDHPRVGIVGCGPWGRNLVRNFEVLGNLSAVCDAELTIREACEDEYPGVPIFSNLSDLVAENVVDAVAIATPAETHAELADEALSAGLHVFVEKPMTTTLSSARALACKAETAGLQLMTGHLLLYHPAFQKLCALVEEGRIGEPCHLTARRLAGVKGKAREDAVWEFAPHDVAMTLALAGTMPCKTLCETPYGITQKAEHAQVTLFFPGGLQGDLLASWRGEKKEQRLVVQGSEATVVFDDVAEKKRKVVLDFGNAREPEAIPFEDGEPLSMECRAFLEAVRTGKEPPSGTSESLKVMTVLDACFRSRENDAAMVLLPEALP